MGSFGSWISSTSESTITIDFGKLEPPSSRYALRLCRRSPHSSFGYAEYVKVKNTYHFDLDHKVTTRSPIHTHNTTSHALKPEPKPTTLMTELTKFFRREWKCIKRGRWGQSKIAKFTLGCSGPVLILGSAALLILFLKRRDRRRRGRQRVAEKGGEDWGDVFQ
jgi:hypothetical protein